MDSYCLTGFVYPVKKNGFPVRGRWQLWVNLPPEPSFDRDGQPHRTIDPDRLQLSELLDRWLEATRGEMRVASYNSYRRIRRLHVDPALGQVLAGKLTRAQLSTYYAAS
jgi:hypothetical protein